MKFGLGDILHVDGGEYQVVGGITYTNVKDNCSWDEYRLLDTSTKAERWLSVDDIYKEYSIWEMTRFPDKNGYHEVDRGVEVVTSHFGSVDVDNGERANFAEFEDETEELIISEEYWSDGVEYSKGYYLDEDEFWLIRKDPGYVRKQNAPVILIVVIFVLVPLLSCFSSLLGNIHFTSTIGKYVDKNSAYTYVTSVTGNEKQKAKVYSTEMTLDATAKDIIAAIEGDTQYVQKDDEENDGAIAILTKKEYCLIYNSIDGGVLVQVSNRKFAYSTDDEPYHASRMTHRYYRRFYYTNGYANDSSSYRNYTSPYSSFDDSSVSYSSDNSYNSYSGSIRQSSIEARQSSGGGLSSGK